ncbi:MAG: lipid A biosynthesis acyltransferase [Bacteroidetes bacterium]|nr:lipid A biosynthesis acyltransferase [Bacteroidota bacterium]
MPAWQGKSNTTTTGYRIFITVLRIAGVSPAYLLLRFVVLYYFFFDRNASNAILDFFRTKIGFTKTVAWRKLYRNYYLFGQSLIDRVVLMAGIKNKFTFNFDGEENLHDLVRGKRGGLLLSAHIGNWEIAGHLLKRIGTRIHIVMFDGEHQQIKKYLDSVTGKRSMNIIVIKNDLSHIYEISDALKNNELVCMHADRFVEGNKIMQQYFLGASANFPMGPFILAAQFKVPVSFVFALKETKWHYHFFASVPKEYKNSDKTSMMQQILYDFAGEMETKVKQYPEQWYNYYDFWRKSDKS